MPTLKTATRELAVFALKDYSIYFPNLKFTWKYQGLKISSYMIGNLIANHE